MTIERVQAEPQTTTLGWDVGTAYEFFVSLQVLHEPEHYDVRASWAAKIRSRIPITERTFLEEVRHFIHLPLGWVHSLPQPKNAITVLYALQQLPADERGIRLMGMEQKLEPGYERLIALAHNRRWDKKDIAELMQEMCHDEPDRDEQALIKFLNWWVRPDDFGNMLYAALQAYYTSFFEQEEQRVGPVLQAGIEHAKALAERVSIPELIAELSKGVQYTEELGRELIVVPAYWTTPLVVLTRIGPNTKLFLFGARPSTMSAIPGELVPDGMLIALKALSDPTRLKILHYLSQEELTPSELARRLNLRAPTVTHHLKELRLAGLINLTVSGQEKRYRARLAALDSIHGDLREFLKGK